MKKLKVPRSNVSLAWQLSEAMKNQGVSKYQMAMKMHTSRSQLDRILDPENDRIQFDTVIKAATVLDAKYTSNSSDQTQRPFRPFIQKALPYDTEGLFIWRITGPSNRQNREIPLGGLPVGYPQVMPPEDVLIAVADQ